MLPHTKETDGLRFHVTRLSPVRRVSWTKYTAPTSGGGGGGGGGAVAPTTYDIVIPSALANTVKADKTKAAGRRHRNADCYWRRYADCHGRKRQDGCPDRPRQRQIHL